MNKLLKFPRSYKYYFLTPTITLAILVYTTIFSLPSYSIVEQARSAESFINTIGVNVHLGYDNTPYMKYDEIVKPRLKELGVKHVRTNIHAISNKQAINKVKDLADIGIKSLIVPNPAKIDPVETVKIVKAQIDGVSMVEGANEWNIHSNKQYKGQAFPKGVINFQKELYSAIKNDPVTAHLDVVAPSLARSHLIGPDVARLGKIPCDFNNMHSYPGGRLPTVKSLDTVHIPINQKMCGTDKPIIATETGYTNALKNKSGVSEEAAAKYINRLFLEYFNRGVKRTYTYELINGTLNPDPTKKGHNWGLLRADGERKRGFKALRNLIAILKDSEVGSSTSSTSKSLDYNLKGNMTNISHTLLQKKNGTFYLILWQEVESYDKANKTKIVVPDKSIELLTNTKISKANIYRPFGSKKPVKSINNQNKISFRVPDHPVVLELIP